MSDNQNCGTQKYAKYDAMTTQELEEILRLDFDAPEGQESDTETLLYIMGVLADRRKINGHAENEALKAYESFKQNYLPEIEKSVDTPDTARKPKRSRLRLLRGFTAAAAVLAVIILGSVTAKAFGLDIWEAVVTWTQETFHFAGWGQTDEPNAGGDLQYASLNEVLISSGIDDPLIPSWIPDGYQLVDVSIEATPMQNIYTAYYQKEEAAFKITVRDYLKVNPEYIEQSEDFVDTYEVFGVTYYLFTNNNRTQAVWIRDSYECYIFGDLTIEELKQMINSI